MRYFIDSISDADMRLKVQQTRLRELHKAVKVATVLDAFAKAERQRRGVKYVRQTDTEDEP